MVACGNNGKGLSYRILVTNITNDVGKGHA